MIIIIIMIIITIIKCGQEKSCLNELFKYSP